MSCSTAVTTNWTPSISQVTATATTVLTSIDTPQASISTRLITTCISTRRSTARSLPTTGNGLSVPATPKSEGDESKLDDLTVAATRSRVSEDNDNENDRRRHRPTSSTTSGNTSYVAPEEVEMERRQVSVPAGLPDNCVRWTVIPSLSTLEVTPSTLFKTTTSVSSSVTTIWQAKETVYQDCPPTTPTPASLTSTVATSNSATSESALSTTTSDALVSSSSGTWVDELSRFSNLSASQTTSSLSESAISGMVAVQTINGNTTDAAIAVVPGLVVSSSATTPTSTSPGESASSHVYSTSSSSVAGSDRGAGAATQAEAASSKEGSSKAVSAGAAIGGIIGVFLLLGAVMFVLRWWMRRKRGNARKTILMRQSWYPPGYDGPDHIADTPPQQGKSTMFGRRDRSQSFFSMSGQGPGNITPSDTSKDLPSAPGSGRRFPGLTMPRIVIPFFKRSSTSSSDQEILDDDKVATPDMFQSSDSITRPSSGTRSKIFPGLNAPWFHSSTNENTNTRTRSPIVPAWAEKYQDAVDSPTSGNGPRNGPGPGRGQGVYTTPVTSRQMRDDQDAILTRNVLKPHTQYGSGGGLGLGIGGLMGPPRLNYEPADGHLSWGLGKSTHATPSPPKRGSRALPALNRPNLEWGHSYAASTKNPNPRHSIMPPPPTGLRSGFVPQMPIPPSPTEESVYSKRESHRSLTSRASTHNNHNHNHDHKTDEPRQLWHSRFSRDQHAGSSSNDHADGGGGAGGGADLGRKPSGLSNPALRSAILSRASASVASLGHLSFQSATTDHSLPPLPEGGLRLDFPLPPSPSTRVPTMLFSTPTPRTSMGPGVGFGAGNVPAPNITRPLMPSRPSIKAFVPTTTHTTASDANHDGNSSSIFEYADYTRTSEYTTTGTTGNGEGKGNPTTKGTGATAGNALNVNEPGGRDTIRQTANWYDKPLWVWDGQSGPLPRMPAENQGLDGQPWSQSQSGGRKSARWDPTDGVAMAL